MKSRGFSLILAIPLIFGVFLFEKFQDLRFKSAEDEARRFLFECANSMAEDFAPNQALYSVYQPLYPGGFEPLHLSFPQEFALSHSKNAYVFTAQKTIASLSPYLKSTTQGIRVFLFGAEGKLEFAL